MAISNNVKVGDLMAMTYYGKVSQVTNHGEEIIVTDLDNGNKPVRITGRELIDRAFSADVHEDTKKASKTEVAEILTHAFNRPLSVSFMKADGTERVLRGRLVKPEPLMGRSMVEDLDKPNAKDRIRQVDHRTLNWLILEGVKYVVK